MKTYAQLDSNNIVVSVIQTEGTITSASIILVPPGIDPLGMTWNGSSFVATQKPEPTERNISGVAYLRRFTQPQRFAIRTLAETDPIAKDLMHLLDSTIAQGGMVNLLDPDTIAGVGYLAAVLPASAIDPAVILL